MSRWPGWRQLLGGERLPEGFAGRLDAEERVLASAKVVGGEVGGGGVVGGGVGGGGVVGGGYLVLTSFGLWLPEGRRIGWHQLSKATWGGGALTLVEAEEEAVAEDVVLLHDLPARRFPLASPGRVPETVHKRVTSSIRFRHRRELPGGGAWFVQRGVAGRDGLLLQVRADPGTDPAAVRRVATQVAGKLKGVGE